MPRMFVRDRLDRCLAALMPRPPAPLVVRFMQCDTIDPGLQAGMAVEAPNPSKHFEEHFLGGIGCVRGIVEQPVNQAVNRLAVSRDKPGKSLFRSGL